MGRGLAQTAETLECSERTLRRYVNEGLLRGERHGRREVRLPYAEENYLHGHWELLSGLRRALRTEKAVPLAVLFGSMATGESRPDSDVDLLIEYRNGDFHKIARLRRRLRKALRRPVHLVLLEDAEQSPSLLADALQEGRVILDREGIWQELERKRDRILRAAEEDETAKRLKANRAVAATRMELSR